MSASNSFNDGQCPLISVIVPVYNVAYCLGDCLDSIVRQTYPNLEIFLIDDCSDDGSDLICKTYAEGDPRIHVIRLDRHQGPSVCRNTGLDAASGNLIGFVDSDDRIDPEMYAKMVQCLYKENADAVICDVTEENRSADSSAPITTIRTEDFETTTGRNVSRMILIRKLKDYSCNKLLKKELLEGIRYPEVVVYEDICTVFRFFIHSEKTVHLNEPLYVYIRRKNSITCKFDIKKERDFNSALLCKLEYCESNEKDLLPDQYNNLFLSMLTFSNLAVRTDNLTFFMTDPSVRKILTRLRENRSLVLRSYHGRMAGLKLRLLTSESSFDHRFLAFLYSAGRRMKRN